MHIQEFNIKRDYPFIVSWGEKQDWPIMPPKYYGHKGYIAYDNDTPIATAFVYRDKGCPFCILEWVIGNPDVDWEVRKEGLDLVIDTASQWAKNDGAEIVLTMTKNKRLIEKYIDNKFIQTDEGVTHLIRRL